VALPLTVDAVVIYLSIILAGCVVVSIADSFAAHEVDTRLHISGAVAIFTQVRGSCVLALLCVNAAADMSIG
jgi:mediator of RNA polymerase II transcription subunit 13